MEFLCRSTADGPPLVAFGGSDGCIRVLSMLTWKVCGVPYLLVCCIAVVSLMLFSNW